MTEFTLQINIAATSRGIKGYATRCYILCTILHICTGVHITGPGQTAGGDAVYVLQGWAQFVGIVPLLTVE